MLEYPPEGAILAEDALKTPDDAQRLLNSCYDVIANLFDGKYQNICELMSDNMAEPNGLDFNAVYNRETAIVQDYYKAQGKLKSIQGVGSIDEIFDRLCTAIG